MNDLIKKSFLSDRQRWLVELMQLVNFGRIEGLRVRGGEPVREPAPRVIQKIKIGGKKGPRAETADADFQLKRQNIEMLDALYRLGEGKVLALEVNNGLCFSLELEIELPGAKVAISAGGRSD